ncbi:asparaginase domain-containing protein [Halopseudomonas pelagia]|uniref:asparaginase domain-containing protein n=1 Tax=Halopseudomonas pelagia TaxID=553151 RepID=UPI0003A5CB8F|nr:asparaginase domain-containing protein [Halopseudomonas pelagia]|tara:strand:- start:51809 stop:52291 length:483 start_codon:yes stop_codon:yes gene_type:complete
MFIQIFSTGGTLDKVYFDALSEYQIGDPVATELLEQARVGFDYAVESLMKKDSLELDDVDRTLIHDKIKACPHEHILITHGTDTMTVTAAGLADIDGKVIVLTGAMQPARFRDSDALFNLGLAIGALNTCQPGVYIAMSGRVFPADGVRKNRLAGRFEER